MAHSPWPHSMPHRSTQLPCAYTLCQLLQHTLMTQVAPTLNPSSPPPGPFLGFLQSQLSSLKVAQNALKAVAAHPLGK